MDACDLLTNPATAGLVARVMLMSGSCYAAPAAVATTAATAAVAAAGCNAAADLAACLRGKPALELAAATSALPPASFSPSIDGHVLAQSPLATLRAGGQVHAPMIIGTTRDELLAFVDGLSPVPLVGDAGYRAAVEALFGAAAHTILELYPLAGFRSPRHALAAALSDEYVICPARRTARAIAAHDPVWRYELGYAAPAGPLAAFEASQGLDLMLAFGNFKGVAMSPVEAALSAEAMAAIGAFADTGEPGLADWPRMTAADEYLVWKPGHDRGTNLHGAACDKWDLVAN